MLTLAHSSNLCDEAASTAMASKGTAEEAQQTGEEQHDTEDDEDEEEEEEKQEEEEEDDDDDDDAAVGIASAAPATAAENDEGVRPRARSMAGLNETARRADSAGIGEATTGVEEAALFAFNEDEEEDLSEAGIRSGGGRGLRDRCGEAPAAMEHEDLELRICASSRSV